MKKLFFALTILVAPIIFTSCNDDDDDQRIDFAELPAPAKEFLNEHFTFSDADILWVEKEGDGTFEIKFTNRTEVDFYNNGIWKEVDVNGNQFPNSIVSLLPQSAQDYLNNLESTIEEIEKLGAYSESGQPFKVELRNDRDIYFDAAGNLK